MKQIKECVAVGLTVVGLVLFVAVPFWFWRTLHPAAPAWLYFFDR